MRIAFAGATLALAALGTLGGLQAASAATAPVYSSSVHTTTVVSPRCLHSHTVTVSRYHWDSARRAYVPYSSPHTTVSDSTTCHA